MTIRLFTIMTILLCGISSNACYTALRNSTESDDNSKPKQVEITNTEYQSSFVMPSERWFQYFEGDIPWWYDLDTENTSSSSTADGLETSVRNNALPSPATINNLTPVGTRSSNNGITGEKSGVNKSQNKTATTRKTSTKTQRKTVRKSPVKSTTKSSDSSD